MALPDLAEAGRVAFGSVAFVLTTAFSDTRAFLEADFALLVAVLWAVAASVDLSLALEPTVTFGVEAFPLAGAAVAFAALRLPILLGLTDFGAVPVRVPALVDLAAPLAAAVDAAAFDAAAFDAGADLRLADVFGVASCLADDCLDRVLVALAALPVASFFEDGLDFELADALVAVDAPLAVTVLRLACVRAAAVCTAASRFLPVAAADPFTAPPGA